MGGSQGFHQQGSAGPQVVQAGKVGGVSCPNANDAAGQQQAEGGSVNVNGSPLQ